MKIIYETGDIVQVDDNSDIGEVSGATVRLLYRLSPGSSVWMVEVTDPGAGGGGPDVGERHHCDEQFFEP